MSLGRSRFLALALALLLGACTVAPQPAPAHLPERGFTVVVPIYREAMLDLALTTLKPYLRDEDRFLIVSGNMSGPVDTAWINRAALELRAAYPYARLYAATSGLGNLERAAQEVGDLVEAVVYIYEPNFPNQPEFSWDFAKTRAHFSEAAERVRAQGFRTVGKPTGRPLLQPSLTDYNWDYGVLATTVDEMLIQTQTYCAESVSAFSEAIREISGQYGARGQTRAWLPQVTIDPVAPNGTSVGQAQACLSAARAQGVEGTVLWWSPAFVERMITFLRGLNIQ